MAIRLKDIMPSIREQDLVITPKLELWLMSHGDDPLPPDVMAIIQKELTTAGRVRSGSFSASSAGRCYRQQELGFLGVGSVTTIDPQLQLIFKDGAWRHLRWQAMGLMVPFLTRIERPLYWRRMRSRGTIDGYGVVDDDHPRTALRGMEYGFELKGTNSWVYRKAVKQEAGTKEEHKRQINRYFLMGGFELFITVYENKDTQEWYEWVEEPDQFYIDEQREELRELNSSINNSRLHDMLPQCKLQTGDTFKQCPFGGVSGPCAKAGRWPNLSGKKTLRKKTP